jgi:hypothetical protein
VVGRENLRFLYSADSTATAESPASAPVRY